MKCNLCNKEVIWDDFKEHWLCLNHPCLVIIEKVKE
jgi:hypothetical protein